MVASRPGSGEAMRIGIISDTHGLVRPAALRALRGCELILHAGDVGHPAVLDALQTLAPTCAVRGNVDEGAWAERLPESLVIDVGGARLYLLHDRARLEREPPPEDVAVVVAGHSHRPLNERRDGVLHFNPGSAGPRRFRLPVAVGRLSVAGGRVRGRIVTLVEGS